MKTLLRLVASSWLLGVLATILIAPLIPHSKITSKYSFVLEPVSKLGDQVIFGDLDTDGTSERIDISYSLPLNNIYVSNLDLHTSHQWNLDGKCHPELSGIFLGNYNNDEYQELYIFTYQSDSLFLNINEIMKPTGGVRERIFVTKIRLVNNEINSKVFYCGLSDGDKDINGELYFSITSGFGLAPRLIYRYNIVTRELTTGPNTSINLIRPRMADLDGDHHPEFFGTSSASGNNDDVRAAYSDYSAWLMVYDDNLQFKFPPVEFPGFGNIVTASAFRNDSATRLLITQSHRAPDGASVVPEISIYSPEGELLIRRRNSELGIPKYFQPVILHTGTRDRLVLASDYLLEIDEQLNAKFSKPTGLSRDAFPLAIDLNEDGSDELLLVSREHNKVAVFGPEFELYGESLINADADEYQFFRLQRQGKDQIGLILGQQTFLLGLTYNVAYGWSWLLYPCIYIFFVGFIVLIKRINTYQVVRRERARQQLLTWQLQSIKGQLNPHFVFNAMNSVAALIYMDDRKGAYDNLTNFTQLLRQVLADAGKTHRTLREEIEFTRIYLDLEKLRFNNKFKYYITVGAGVTMNERVPILVLQSFAENAVKHGLMHRDNGGLLNISIQKKGLHVFIVIQDNGVGRKKAATINHTSGTGLKLTTEFYGLLNQVFPGHANFNITDLYDDTNLPAGTRIEVNIVQADVFADPNGAFIQPDSSVIQ